MILPSLAVGLLVLALVLALGDFDDAARVAVVGALLAALLAWAW